MPLLIGLQEHIHAVEPLLKFLVANEAIAFVLTKWQIQILRIH